MRSQKVFAIRSIAADIENVLSRRGIAFVYDESGLIGHGRATVQGVSIPLAVGIDPTELILSICFSLPVRFTKEDEGVGALAVCRLNADLTAGCFDLHKGEVSFRSSIFFRDSQISSTALLDMLELCISATQVYLTPLCRLANGEISLQRFIATLI